MYNVPSKQKKCTIVLFHVTQEISDAIFQMGPLNAPGPDGLPARFFQQHWEVLRDDVVRAVQMFFAEGVTRISPMTKVVMSTKG